MSEVEERSGAGDRSVAWARAAVAEASTRPELLLEAARLAEAAGDVLLALRAWQRVVQASPQLVEAWRALAILHEERGDLVRAGACRARASELGGTPDEVAASPEPDVDDGLPGPPSDADLVRFADRFAGRDDHHARMWADPDRGAGYAPVRQPLTADLARAHLAGAVTVGTYLLRVDGTTRLVVLDIDATRAALDHARGHADRTRELQACIHDAGLAARSRLRALDLDPVLEDSGHKGRHLWLFLEDWVPAGVARAAGRALAAAIGPLDRRLAVEVFPKQDALAKGGLGNLVKLPLGLHLRSGRRCPILGEDGEPEPDPFARLRSARAVSVGRLHELATGVGDESPPVPVTSAGGTPLVPTARPSPQPAWTEADFERSPQVAPVLDGCAVIRHIVEEALARGVMTHDRAVVLNHALGHLPDGARACNHLYDRVPDFPPSMRMGAPHRGSPISCAKIRARVPEVAARGPCACVFSDVPGRYPSPLRHLDGVDLETREPPGRTLDELLDRWAAQARRLQAIQGETDALRGEVVAALAGIPDRAWAVEGGAWRLEDEDGMPVLRWEPA